MSFSVFSDSACRRLRLANTSRGLRPGSKVHSEHLNDWQYLSLGDLEQTEFDFFLAFNYLKIAK